MTNETSSRLEPPAGPRPGQPQAPWRRAAAGSLLALAAVLGSGCAALNTVQSDVVRYGQWPAAARPGSFTFERLPSQQQPDATAARAREQIEAAATRALQGAGFQPAAAGAAADYRVQVGVRLIGEIDDTRWGPGGPYGPWGAFGPYPWGRYGVGPWYGRGVWGPSFGWGATWRHEPVRYDREVALLIRDGRTGTPLYETRAVNTGASSDISEPLMAALFEAALKDFPAASGTPERVLVPWPGR